MTHQYYYCTSHLEYKRWFCPDESGVGLQQRGEPDGKLGYAVRWSFTEVLWFLAPGKEQLVAINVRNDIEYLLRGIAEEMVILTIKSDQGIIFL